MPPTSTELPLHASAEAINAAIQELAGSVVEWTPEALAELDGLYRAWDAARAAEAG